MNASPAPGKPTNPCGLVLIPLLLTFLISGLPVACSSPQGEAKKQRALKQTRVAARHLQDSC